MKVFISYHRADTRYRRDAERILSEHGIDYYAVPEDGDLMEKRMKQSETLHADTFKNVMCSYA